MALQISNISFGYSQSLNVLNDISIDVNKGETLSVVGASGCGKSTLLRLVSGILPNKRSDKFLGNILIDSKTPNEYIKEGKLAFMFQEATLMPNLTAKENIAFPLKIKGIKDNNRVNELIEIVGLTEYANYLPNQLSGGMKTRVSLARSFVTQPDLLLLDEPFSALDIAWKSKLYVELEKLRNRHNTTVIIVTHDVQEALLLSNQVLVLNTFGSVQVKHHILSDMTLNERVYDISGFLAEVYTDYYLPIQKAIMLDGNRRTASKSDLVEFLQNLNNVTGNELLENEFSSNSTDFIRKYSNDLEVNQLLVTSFYKAKTAKLKYQLVWDILEFENLSDEIRNKMFLYYLENLECFTRWSKDWYSLKIENENPLALLEILKGRIDTNKLNYTKNWIYLCDMYAVGQLQETSDYLNQIINGEITCLNYPFAKEVANLIKDKIENEKKNNISVG